MPDIYVAPKAGKKKKEKLVFQSLAKIGVKPSKNFLGAFVGLPKKLNFETQEKKEKILLLLRRHWLTNMLWLFSIILIWFLPLFLSFLPSFSFSFLPFRFRLIGILMWYLFSLSFFFEKFLSWFFNVYIISDERLIDVDFLSLVYREISQAQIDRIQDVTVKSGGLLKTIFDYGDVFVQTAAKEQTIEFESVPHPGRVAQLINELIMEEEQEKLEGRVR